MAQHVSRGQEEETARAAGPRGAMALITCTAGSRNGGRKRRKKCHHNIGFSPCCRIEHGTREDSPVRSSNTECVQSDRVDLFPQWGTTFRHNTVSSSSLVCSYNSLCKRQGTTQAHCDTNIQVYNHSRPLNPDTSAIGVTVHLRRPATTLGSQGRRCKHQFFSVLALIVASHALLTTTSRTSTAQAAAVPSPSYVSAAASRANARYKLVPASQNPDSIFIYLNPHSILNLKVNTRKNVFFNFTTHRRQPHPTSLNKTIADDGSTSIPNPDEPQKDDSFGLSTATATNATGSNSNPSPFITSTTSSSSSGTSNFTSWPFSRSYLDTVNSKVTNLSDDSGPIYWVMIYSDDDSIARPVVSSPSGLAVAQADAKGSYILMAVWAGRQYNFSVEARHIGRATMSVALVGVDGDRRMPQASYVQAVAASQYTVTAIRGERTADLVFNISAAAIAIIISFGVGAVTDTDSLKRQLKYPVALIIGFCCQFVIMPMMAFAMAMMLPLDKEILFGLLCVACVPGGGISHVAVIIADGDTALSLTMNLVNVVAMLGTAPLWIFVLGQYFQSDPQAVLNPRMIPIYNFEIWFASIFFAYAAGLTIKRLRPTVADGILMWLIKPFLLLASILYITLGVYINMYVFELINGYALLGAMLLPLGGCILGGILAAICRQNYSFVKTIALETSSLNCLVVLVALRFSLKQPDADLAAVIPIWVMFTIPGFFVFLAICNKVKNVLLHFWRNRNSKESDVLSSSKAYSISSSVVSPPGTTTMSAPLVTTDGMDDDATISTLSNQKVTVL